MITRFSIGPIILEGGFEKEISTPNIIGYIEKVKIEYGNEHAEDMFLEIETSDGEKIMTIQGSKDGLWYPRNWNIQNQQYAGVNIAAEGQNAMNAERYLSYGPLKIRIKGSIKDDHIKRIEFTIDGTVEGTVEFMKDMVSTSTPGVNNAVYGKRKERERLLMKYMEGVIDKEISQEIKKQDPEDLREFIENSLYQKKFDGINKTISEQIKDFILRGVVKKYPKKRIEGYITRKAAVNTAKAALIYRTETHELRNKVREWSYKQLPDYEASLFKWIGPKDYRTTLICKAITRKTKNGVSMEELKKIIADEVQNAIDREELPPDFDPREYTPHFGCRHTYIKSY